FIRLSGLKYSFEDGKLTLIRGTSGQGKSSILESIAWCLYGKQAATDVDCPLTGKKAKVKITFHDMIIERSRDKAGSIQVRTADGIYNGPPAEDFIVNKFGTYDVWSITSYLTQGCRNAFLHNSSEKKRL